MANEGFGTLLLNDVEDIPLSVEPFTQGMVAVPAVEPFDMTGTPVAIPSVEVFWMSGTAATSSVEPFDLGDQVFARSDESFDMLSAADFLLETTDLGDGDSVASTAKPILGWWEET